MSFGRFQTELSLFKHFSMPKTFAGKGLIPNADNMTEKDILSLTKRCVLEDPFSNQVAPGLKIES